MISKKNWISESQESHSNFHNNEVEVNEETFTEVQNYLQAHESK
jgi:hypothetical protein